MTSKLICTLAIGTLFVVGFSVITGEDKLVTEICLGCICEAISGCNLTKTCNGDVCGLFRITWAYWADGGKNTLKGESPDSSDAYKNCVNDPYCAADTIQGYMGKFGQDCNGDNDIDCYDYAAIHKLGGYGCKGELGYKYVNELSTCLKKYPAALDARIDN